MGVNIDKIQHLIKNADPKQLPKMRFQMANQNAFLEIKMMVVSILMKNIPKEELSLLSGFSKAKICRLLKANNISKKAVKDTNELLLKISKWKK